MIEIWFASKAALHDAMNTPLGKRITEDANETFGTPGKTVSAPGKRYWQSRTL